MSKYDNLMLQVINHLITVEELRHPEQKKTACYDIDVEVDDTLKTQMNSFLLSTASQQVIPFVKCILFSKRNSKKSCVTVNK